MYGERLPCCKPPDCLMYMPCCVSKASTATEGLLEDAVVLLCDWLGNVPRLCCPGTSPIEFLFLGERREIPETMRLQLQR